MYGGSFIYHLNEEDKFYAVVGYVVSVKCFVLNLSFNFLEKLKLLKNEKQFE